MDIHKEFLEHVNKEDDEFYNWYESIKDASPDDMLAACHPLKFSILDRLRELGASNDTDKINKALQDDEFCFRGDLVFDALSTPLVELFSDSEIDNGMAEKFALYHFRHVLMMLHHYQKMINGDRTPIDPDLYSEQRAQEFRDLPSRMEQDVGNVF